MVTVNIRDFPPELHRLMKIQAAKEGITMKLLIEKAIREYIERHEVKERKERR